MTTLAPVPDVADVTLARGPEARADAAPDLLLEVPHGATRAAHFDALRSALRGAYAADLRDFFFVNTDVGAPELAHRIAARFVAAHPTRTAAVVVCRVPRTFVDCNRVLPPAAEAAPHAPGAMTPGLMPWVVDPDDRRLLRARHAAYVDLVARAVEATLPHGGRALMVHTYAPRTVDVAVDADVVRSLHAAYAPDVVGRWPLRAEVDLITRTPDGVRLADEALVAAAHRALAAEGVEAAEERAYALHPSTVAADVAGRHPGRTLCFEVRRDLLVPAFTPFAEMVPSPDLVERFARPFARALDAAFAPPSPR